MATAAWPSDRRGRSNYAHAMTTTSPRAIRAILKGLAKLPDETVVDGELVAFDAEGKPSFNALQNSGSSETPIVYYVFDVLVLAGRDVCGESLEVRRDLLERKVLPKLGEPVRY